MEAVLDTRVNTVPPDCERPADAERLAEARRLSEDMIAWGELDPV
jgi:hypothetical protein